MKLRPLNDHVIIKRLEAETKSAGGIVIPDTAKEKPMKGEVIAIGSGRILKDGHKVPMSVKIGDKVLIGKYSGTEFKMHDEEYVSIEEKDIIAVIEGK